MKSAIQALVWEQVWKNRAVFPLLVVVTLMGGGITEALVRAQPDAWWSRTAVQILLAGFAMTVLLCFAPFTLMEGRAGWRMNSMVTRWFVLPVRTVFLVVIPYVAACLVVTLFVGLWLLFFRRLVPELDAGHVLRVMVLGVAVTQTLAWLLPRKPSQFWPALAVWFPAMLMLALLPLDSPEGATQREFVKRVVIVALPVLGLVMWVAAGMNRRGAWRGEIPLRGLLTVIMGRRWPLPRLRSARQAMFFSEVLPVLKLYWLGGTVVLLLVVGTQWLLFLKHRGEVGMPAGMLLHAAVILVPALAVIGLPLGGIFLGAEPGMGFRTALSGYRAVRPISSCQMAAQSLWVALGMWVLTWGLWVVLVTLHLRLYPAIAEMDVPVIQASAPRLMAITAHALVGALPLIMWGRLDGFPNVLVTSMVAWAGTWWLAGLFNPEALDAAGLRTLCMVLLATKSVLGLGALGIGWRRGHVTVGFATGLVTAWLLVVGLLSFLESSSQRSIHQVCVLALFVPFARLAFCPIAMALNRHR